MAVCLIDPALVVIYYFTMDVETMWNYFGKQGIAVSVVNLFIVCLLVSVTWKFNNATSKNANASSSRDDRLLHLVRTICVLQFMSLFGVVSEHLNVNEGVKTPLIFWTIFDSIRTMPEFCYMLKKSRQKSQITPSSTMTASSVAAK
eukprot:CAMPEP_0203743716 /NCGR_PEP_ID=MMETSP0098-20131031/38_1 /ASSEMBLY_ACC=CAM_ASM_000208 /TAXON_ID=96639 /ORGANISM=" , Strain NY0313808BC1" /LENGTH=145 /DNA_ID=CAMNT_0050631039 /DNA_START=120 /DNA_END=554 /DNA_ORIENTATION=-